ncbi:hypothetical protein TWF679_006210 [Orbilia oligospora]|uniref:CCHC-type domain-containing protein n=1 Tax=Orbilia oligospora TaxID=2813651 RepID=A0A8H8UP88_ORBOL|nr:hypothetical protein TWF679_006210 [Orbilia oligospora]
MAGVNNEQEQIKSIYRSLQDAPKLQNAIIFAYESKSLERYKSAILNTTNSGYGIYEKTKKSTKSTFIKMKSTYSGKRHINWADEKGKKPLKLNIKDSNKGTKFKSDKSKSTSRFLKKSDKDKKSKGKAKDDNISNKPSASGGVKKDKKHFCYNCNAVEHWARECS